MQRSYLESFFSKKNLFCLIIVVFIFFLDRFTKILIIKNQLTNKALFINDFLNFELVWNNGIGFGLLSMNSGFYYHLISFFIFVILVLIMYLLIKSKNADKFIYAVVLGGALGNFYDRIIYFAVPDFIDLHFNQYHWFTFNIADVFISLGIILLIFNEMIFKNEN